jgi:hypothetical protein
MKRIILAIAVTLGLCACEAGLFGEVGNGVSMTQEIEVGDFDRISIPDFVDVYYTQSSDQQCVTLTCDENLFEYYHVEVKDGKLIVYCKGSFYNKIDTYLTVCSSSLKGVKLSGSGDLYIEEALTTEDDFTIETSGSGDVDIASMTASSTTVSLTGSGDARIGSMTVSSAEFKSSGRGDIEAEEVKAESISIKTTGSGDCSLCCKDSGTLSVQISGSGDVILRGTARALINISQTGSGDFNMSDLTLSGK